jgi:hypothetical protein
VRCLDGKTKWSLRCSVSLILSPIPQTRTISVRTADSESKMLGIELVVQNVMKTLNVLSRQAKQKIKL